MPSKYDENTKAKAVRLPPAEVEAEYYAQQQIGQHTGHT